jgi:hypothetical protein
MSSDGPKIGGARKRPVKPMAPDPEGEVVILDSDGEEGKPKTAKRPKTVKKAGGPSVDELGWTLTPPNLMTR